MSREEQAGETPKPIEPYTYAWAGRELGFTVRTIAAMVKDGRIGYVVNGRLRRIYPEHAKAYKRANERKPRRGRRATGATY